MLSRNIQRFRNKVERYIDSRRLHDAIREIKEAASKSMAWAVTDDLSRVEEAYAYMLKYVADGVDDPERADVYLSIVAGLYEVLDSFVFFKEKAENPSEYFSAYRTYQSNHTLQPIPDIIKSYKDAADKTSLFSLLSSAETSADERNNALQTETLQAGLFRTVWVKPTLQYSDTEAIIDAIKDDAFTPEFKMHLISAVTLGLFEQFDAGKMQVLMDAYMAGGNAKATSAALVGLILGMWKYRSRPLSKKLADRLAAVKEVESWHSDLKIAYLELIRARDTERINKKIQDEVIPDMMNLKPEIMNKINEEGLTGIDMASLQENPEWQELLDKNGITDKLKELTEMQMEGGDVMMGTFSHLKNFAFFYNISNWFLPFSASNSNVKETANKLGVMSEMIENASFLCDSDKYSFMFALQMVPKEQRDIMTSQLQAQSDSIYEAMGEATHHTSEQIRKKTVNQYIQNIYRFFKLYRRKDEFFDPFDGGINLINVPSLADDFNDVDMLQVLAEFYFKLGYMQDAIDVFKRIENVEKGDAQRYQKMGYCYEKMQKYDDAIKYYQQAELLDMQGAWTLRRLASCYRAIGDTAMALKYYKELATINPDDLTIALLLGYVMLENGDYSEALHQFYKVEFLDEKSSKSWRPLAWTLFVSGDFEASKRYFNKIIESNPNANDYLNMGHLALATNDMKNAVNYYMLSIQMRGGDREAFVKSMKEDMSSLLKVGVKQEVIPLITDAVFYTMEN